MSATWPVQPRGGFTGFPNDVLARAIGMLTPEQLRLFLGLAYSAEYEREGSVSPDGRWCIPWACTLASYPGMAKAYGMSEDAVRRALRRFGEVALATSAAASPATPPATSAATPPRIVSFGSWFGNRARAEEAATPPATPSATPPAVAGATIQQENKGTREEAREAAPPVLCSPAAAERWPLGEKLRQDLTARFAPQANGGAGLKPPSTAAEREQLEQDLAAVGYPNALAEAIRYGSDKGAGASTRSLSFWTGRLNTFANPSQSSRTNGRQVTRTNGHAAPAELRAWPEVATDAEMAAFIAERHALAPELDGFPVSTTRVERQGAWVELPAVAELIAKHRGLVQDRVRREAAQAAPVQGLTAERRAAAEAVLKQHGLAGRVAWGGRA